MSEELVKRYRCHRCGRVIGKMGPHNCCGNYWKRHSKYPGNYTEVMVAPKPKKVKKPRPKKPYDKPAITLSVKLWRGGFPTIRPHFLKD